MRRSLYFVYTLFVIILLIYLEGFAVALRAQYLADGTATQ